MLDVIAEAHMVQEGAFTSFTSDRFGSANSALALNGSWTKVPSGIYFDTPEFTISAWILPQTTSFRSRLLDFGNGPDADNIVFGISYDYSPQPIFGLYNGTSLKMFASSPQNLTLGVWQFLAATFDGTTMAIYVNGQTVASINMPYSLTPLLRNSCYIGKDNWGANGFTNSYIDDLRFYNKSLTQTELIEVCQNTSLCQLITSTTTTTTAPTSSSSSSCKILDYFYLNFFSFLLEFFFINQVTTTIPSTAPMTSAGKI